MAQEQANVWRASDVPGIELLQATFTTHSFPKHFHESYGIGLSDRGSGIIHSQGAKHVAASRQLIFFHPGQVHSGYANEQAAWTYRMIYLDLALVTELEENTSTISFSETTFDNRAIATAFTATHSRFSQSASTLERETFLQNFVKILKQQTEDRCVKQHFGRNSKAVKFVQEYLEANYQKNVSIKTLAHLAGFSPNYLVTAFHREVGIPPHQYQAQVRVRYAKTDLRTQKSLAQIAIDTGFCDQSHLNRCFKRLVGVNPRRIPKA
jgi:AraC-like DNA-binding protein